MGYYGGKFDLFFQRLIEIWSSLPMLFVIIIFSSDKDSIVLIKAFRSLKKDGYKEDQAADEISKMIFKELQIEPDHLKEE